MTSNYNPFNDPAFYQRAKREPLASTSPLPTNRDAIRARSDAIRQGRVYIVDTSNPDDPGGSSGCKCPGCAARPALLAMWWADQVETAGGTPLPQPPSTAFSSGQISATGTQKWSCAIGDRSDWEFPGYNGSGNQPLPKIPEGASLSLGLTFKDNVGNHLFVTVERISIERKNGSCYPQNDNCVQQTACSYDLTFEFTVTAVNIDPVSQAWGAYQGSLPSSIAISAGTSCPAISLSNIEWNDGYLLNKTTEPKSVTVSITTNCGSSGFVPIWTAPTTAGGPTMTTPAGFSPAEEWGTEVTGGDLRPVNVASPVANVLWLYSECTKCAAT